MFGLTLGRLWPHALRNGSVPVGAFGAPLSVSVHRLRCPLRDLLAVLPAVRGLQANGLAAPTARNLLHTLSTPAEVVITFRLDRVSYE
jgi:hypothetical protein